MSADMSNARIYSSLYVPVDHHQVNHHRFPHALRPDASATLSPNVGIPRCLGRKHTRPINRYWAT